MKETNYRNELKAAYERVISGELTNEQLCEEAIVLYKGAHRIFVDDEQYLLWGDHVEDFDKMPHDCYCELIKTPTHMAASLLIYVWQNSSKAREFGPLREAMMLGLKGAILYGFRGHGYDAEEDFLVNMRLYNNVNAEEFVENYPYICPEFTDEYVKRIEALKEIVDYEEWKK